MLVAGAKLYSYNKTSTDKHVVTDALMAERMVSEMKASMPDAEERARSFYMATLSFADQDLPVNVERVENTITRHLRNLSYRNTHTYRLHHQAAYFLPRVAAILNKYGIPEDFKYIPLIESGLQAGTSSHRGASGYWQFMPATARSFGLRVNEAVDERQDLGKSTHAAARYLNQLYEEFGDWTLVAAAFNVGEGRLQRVINAQKQDDYFKLRINKETDAYVYKLVSMKEIIENPDRHGYTRGRAIMAQASQEAGYDPEVNRI